MPPLHLLLAASLAVPAQALSRQGAPPPQAAELATNNVLIVLADDVSIAELAIYGLDPSAPADLTPNIDALAASGILFLNAWANPLCSPTRASLLTGRHAFRTGIGAVIENGAVSLSAAELTLPEAIGQYAPSPYTSSAFGKWHLRHKGGALPCPATQAHGFDAFDGALYKVGPGYCQWDRLSCPGSGATVPSLDYTAASNFDAAAAWIAVQPGPWFCYLAPESPYELPHVPPPALQAVVSGPACAACPGQERDCWNAALQAFDTKLGELVAGLGPGWRTHTTIVLAGDNGAPNNVNTYWPSGRTKGTLYEGGIHVPLIIAGRAVDPALRGTISDELVGITDLFRTVTSIVGATGLPPTVAEDSFDLAPLLSSPPGKGGRTTLVAEKFEQNLATGPYEGHGVAIRGAQYKLIWNCSTSQPLGLYDLWNDPLELNDLLLPTIPPPGTPAGDALLFLRDEVQALIGC